MLEKCKIRASDYRLSRYLRAFFQIEIIYQGAHRHDRKPMLSKSARIDGNQKIPRSSATSASKRRERHRRRVQISGQDRGRHVLDSSLLSKPSVKRPTTAHGETASVCRAWNALGEQHGRAWKSINYTNNISDFLKVLGAGSSRAPLVLCTTVQGCYVRSEIKRVIKIRQEKQHFNFFSFCLFLGRTSSKTVPQKAVFELTGN